MGQHRTNPTAISASLGHLSKADRKPTPKTPTHTEREIVGGGAYRRAKGGNLVRAIPKVRGKANVKRARRDRMARIVAEQQR